MMKPLKGFHITVIGMVQGVGYRYYCTEAAAALGLNGFVMNMPDGSVEIEVFGGQKGIDAFLSEITGKHASYSVSTINKYEIPVNTDYRGFEIAQYPGH
jgi:acylphosphatase